MTQENPNAPTNTSELKSSTPEVTSATPTKKENPHPVHKTTHATKHKLVEPLSTIDDFFLEFDDSAAEEYKVRKKLGMSVSKTSKPKSLSLYDQLKVSFIKAGMNTDPVIVLKKLLLLALIIDVLLSLLLLITGLSYAYATWAVIVATVLCLILLPIVLYPIIYAIFKMVLQYKIFRRKMQIEMVLPDFLRLVASNYRSGLPLDKALIKSNRPRFGVFSKEVELMAKTTKMKGDLSVALEIFGKKFNSKILERSMNSMSMSVKSGSNISFLLEEIANNIMKMRNMQKSMAANVKNYIIFIIVAAVIIAPLMFGMSFAMTSTIDTIKGSLIDGASPGVSQGNTLSALSYRGGISPDHFDIFATMMLITTSVISALVISIIKYGNYQQGYKSIPIFIIVSNLLYYLGKYAVMSMLNVF